MFLPGALRNPDRTPVPFVSGNKVWMGWNPPHGDLWMQPCSLAIYSTVTSTSPPFLLSPVPAPSTRTLYLDLERHLLRPQRGCELEEAGRVWGYFVKWKSYPFGTLLPSKRQTLCSLQNPISRQDHFDIILSSFMVSWYILQKIKKHCYCMLLIFGGRFL